MVFLSSLDNFNLKYNKIVYKEKLIRKHLMEYLVLQILICYREVFIWD